MGANSNLHKAKEAKNDEFYTRIEDINEEMNHYEDKFRGKVVFCNCDDPKWSNFWKYFHMNFEYLGLKKLIATHYEAGEVQTYKIEYTGGNDLDFDDGKTTTLQQNGDFRSDECIELLKEADIVVTNPPFSLWRSYIAQLFEYNKRFIILGNVNALTYKEVFPYIRDNKLWLGASIHSGDRKFYVPDNYPLNAAGCGIDEEGRRFIRVKGVRWFTNVDYPARHKDIETTYLYAKRDELYPDLYLKFDNYDAINVDKVSQIPMDYKPCWYECPQAHKCPYAESEGDKEALALCEEPCNGVMGVPVTYMDKHNPDQFEIIGATESEGTGFSNGLWNEKSGVKQPVITKHILDNKHADEHASTDRPTDRPTDYTTVQTDIHPQQKNVMASWESQSRSSTNTTRNNLNSSVCSTTVQTANGTSQKPYSTEKKSLRGWPSVRKCNGVMGVPITFLDKYNPDQFEIVAFRKAEGGKNLVFTREKEREFNRTFVSLYDVDSGNDKGCRRRNKWQEYLRQNNNLAKIEPIDMFFPNATNLANTLVNDCRIDGKKTYVRILIRKKERL